ncbi:tetraspanin-13-like isoform X2 [Pollicipes pollicipes]|uniref:tetraspanin-13-like isoform X2 n=1 Tax=Pollicipes pollicipes TaxID=41117 RepID=UPI001884A70F|nr:tetraspanin-13-like isoform X2 [Pollicipes pollicipes]
MCGGFTCTKNSLIGLNILYMVVAFLLIGVATYGKTSSIITSINVVGGIVACGVFLLFIAVMGIMGAMKHHQVLLFFYMMVLFLLFLVQFSVACACLAVNKEQQQALAAAGWQVSNNDTKTDAQNNFECCGFNVTSNANLTLNMLHPPCPKQCCAANDPSDQCCMGASCECQPCLAKVGDAINSGLRASGGVGLFFSFTEVIGFILAFRHRRQADPDRVQVLE